MGHTHIILFYICQLVLFAFFFLNNTRIVKSEKWGLLVSLRQKLDISSSALNQHSGSFFVLDFLQTVMWIWHSSLSLVPHKKGRGIKCIFCIDNSCRHEHPVSPLCSSNWSPLTKDCCIWLVPLEPPLQTVHFNGKKIIKLPDWSTFV